MQYKFFTIPAISAGASPAEDELNSFLRNHRVLTVQRELLCNGQQSCWCCCVEYLDGASSVSGKGISGDKVDYREVLNDEEFSRYSLLRDIRKRLSDSDHLPPYAILLNEQLADLARLPEIDEKALKHLNGFGEKKYERFGRRILEMLSEKRNEADGASL